MQLAKSLAAWTPPLYFTGLLSAISYGTVSVAITLFNRAIFSVWSFNYPCTVVALQLFISLMMLLVLRRCGVFTFSDFDLNFARTVFPFSVVWFVHIASGVTALRYLTVPTFAVLRRTTTPLLMLLEFVAYRKWPPIGASSSVVVMLLGALIASLNDIQFSLPGYLCTFLCVLMTALYLMYIPYLKKKLQATDAALLFYNNLMSLPVMLLYIVIATDELRQVAAFPHIGELKFQLFLVVSCSQAFLLNICIFHCTNMNSPLMTSVVGQLKDFLTTALGLILFGDVIYNFWNVTGVVIGLIGGSSYAVVSFKANSSHAKSREIIGSSQKSPLWKAGANAGGEISPLLAIEEPYNDDNRPRPTAKAALAMRLPAFLSSHQYPTQDLVSQGSSMVAKPAATAAFSSSQGLPVTPGVTDGGSKFPVSYAPHLVRVFSSSHGWKAPRDQDGD